MNSYQRTPRQRRFHRNRTMGCSHHQDCSLRDFPRCARTSRCLRKRRSDDREAGCWSNCSRIRRRRTSHSRHTMDCTHPDCNPQDFPHYDHTNRCSHRRHSGDREGNCLSTRREGRSSARNRPRRPSPADRRGTRSNWLRIPRHSRPPVPHKSDPDSARRCTLGRRHNRNSVCSPAAAPHRRMSHSPDISARTHTGRCLDMGRNFRRCKPGFRRTRRC